jgi:hypothetical protein
MSVLYFLLFIYALTSSYLASQDAREYYKLNGKLTAGKLLSTFFLFWAYGAGLAIITLGFLAVHVSHGIAHLYARFQNLSKRFWLSFKYSLAGFIVGALFTFPFVTKFGISIFQFFLREFIIWILFLVSLNGWMCWLDKRKQLQ